MVKWSGIEDVEAIPSRIWLCREKETDEWKPLRKVDCKALNESPGYPVLIEKGRATADPEFGVIRSNYIKAIERKLTSGTWFVKKEDENDKKKQILEPMEDKDAQVAEQLYKKAVDASSSLGKGINSIDKGIPLIDGKYRIEIQKQSGSYCLRKVPTGWFAKSFDLQRGYGTYQSEGEDYEEALGPVKDLIFVVHGVGEAMWSRDDFTLALGMEKEMKEFRLTMQKKQIEGWKKSCESAKRKGLPEPARPNRVELVPIMWYDRIHSSSNTLSISVQAATLSTIPALREIANDVILDVLMYLTPNFCHEVLECVTDQIIASFKIFQKANPEFLESGGKCSLLGHSLGSVICWDLLSILKESKEKDAKSESHGVHIIGSSGVGFSQYASGEKRQDANYGSWGPSLPKSMDRCLPFDPEFTIFLGSPLGLFLSLRGAHKVFEDLKQNRVSSSRISPFTLPSRSIHNIFHPSDPIAYRIEPLLLPHGTEDIPPPAFLTLQGQGVRLHVKAKQLGDDIRKSINETKTSVSTFVSGIKDQATTILEQLDEGHHDANKQPKQKGIHFDDSPLRFPLAGINDRLDFQLQPKVIDSEYLSAVTAHATYFANADVLDYLIDLTALESRDKRNNGDLIVTDIKAKGD